MNMEKKRLKLRPARGGVLWTVALSLPLLAACDIQEILESTSGQGWRRTRWTTPRLASTLVTGVVSEVECSWNQFTAGMAHHSDEYIPTSGNLDLIRWGERRIEDVDVQFGQGLCGGGTYPTYTPLQTARFQGEDVLSRLDGETFAGIDGLADLRAVARTWGTFPLIALGEAFCEMTVPTVEGGARAAHDEAGGPCGCRDQVRRGDQHGAGGRQHGPGQHCARRACPRTDRPGELPGAMADAAWSPPVSRPSCPGDASESRRWNYYYERLNALTGSGSMARFRTTIGA